MLVECYSFLLFFFWRNFNYFPHQADHAFNLRKVDFKSGKIADHIDDLGPHVFEQLTKVKLAEIERLREAIAKQIEADKGAHKVKVFFNASAFEHFFLEYSR